MSFTAMEAMRQTNKARFGQDLGPFPPPLFPGEEIGTDLKSAALRFLERRCVGLRFNPERSRTPANTSEPVFSPTRFPTICRWISTASA